MGIVRLTQHVPPVAVADNHTAAAEATLAQRGDRMIAGEEARQELIARQLIVAEQHLYLTR